MYNFTNFHCTFIASFKFFLISNANFLNSIAFATCIRIYGANSSLIKSFAEVIITLPLCNVYIPALKNKILCFVENIYKVAKIDFCVTVKNVEINQIVIAIEWINK